MTAFLDLTNFTFTTEQIRALNELLFTTILDQPDAQIKQIHTIKEGAVSDKKIDFVSKDFGLVGKARQGCSPTAISNQLATSEKTWAMKAWGDRLVQCFTDLEDALTEYSLKTGVNIADLTGTDIAALMQDALEITLRKNFMRLVWMNDTAAALTTASPAGVITAGTTIGYFNLLDGLFKQAATIIAADANRRTTIAANAQVTYALQESVLTPALALQYVQENFTRSSIKSRQKSDLVQLCTDSIWIKVLQALQSASGYTPQYTNLTNGMKSIQINGMELISVPIWDELIRAYEDNGTYWNKPHRIITTPKSNIVVGVDTYNAFSQLDMFMDKYTRQLVIDMGGKIDVKFLEDELVQYAC